MHKEVRKYQTENNEIPFDIWSSSLEKHLRSKVDQKVIRLSLGNYSDCSILRNADGVREARIRAHSGIRIYFAEDVVVCKENEQKTEIILLLIGGDKDTQKRDIKLAKEYWNDYK